MRRALRIGLVGLIVAAGNAGCAGGVHDRQVLNPDRDWRTADNRKERMARFKAPFVRLGSRLRGLNEPAAPPALSIQPLDEPESSAVDRPD